jgi:hypothetical protein
MPANAANFWYNIQEKHVIELFCSTCFAPWCFMKRCTSDQYPDQQRKEGNRLELEVKQLLEESGTEKMDPKEGLQQFKQYMEHHNLIRLLPGVVPGFSLRNRKWGKFVRAAAASIADYILVQIDIQLLNLVRHGDTWHDLVLPEGHREMVQAMVETHAQGSRSATGRSDKIEMDLVRGKGMPQSPSP